MSEPGVDSGHLGTSWMFMGKRGLAAILFCLFPVAASAQAPAQLNVAHFVDPRPEFVGAPGQTLQNLRALTPAEFETAKEKAAGGDAGAETLLCVAYRVGQFVEQDPKIALIWCQKAADQDNPVAIEELGMIYYGASADAGTRDAEKAITWLTKAADRGSNSAMDNLGTIYADGLGVAQDYSRPCSGIRSLPKLDSSRQITKSA
jgi:TPR repeat protein